MFCTTFGVRICHMYKRLRCISSGTWFRSSVYAVALVAHYKFVEQAFQTGVGDALDQRANVTST